VITAGAPLAPGAPAPIADGSAFFPQSIASGDPRPDSVILWTRVEDPDREGDLDLGLQVALDEAFAQRLCLDTEAVLAPALHDRCARVKLRGLRPATTYHYRFVYTKNGRALASRPGRTRTAPAPGDDVKVRFAFVSCQDRAGGHFNAYLALAREEVDFFVHLGDYIYETQASFADQAGAIALGESGPYAARSLDNYRELYRAYRSDPALQAVHERFAMIATWDDHEFADDCNGATAQYFDGRKDETDVGRREAADQAWFEHQPVDCTDQVYRDLVFGAHLHLVMTDLRSYRAQNLIPAGAFPGAVVATQEALVAALGAIPELASPYVDIASYQGGAYQRALAGAGLDPALLQGNISVPFINLTIGQMGADSPVPPIDDAAAKDLSRGFAYLDAGKFELHGSSGARYFVVKDVFDVLGRLAYQRDRGSQEVMGEAQERWFLRTMRESSSTWKVWGNEYCLSQLAVDLGAQPLPAPFQRRFYLDAEGWDGYRDRRSELLAALAGVGGVVAITGDIHAFYAGTPSAEGDPGQKIVELVGSSISSTTFRSELVAQIQDNPLLGPLPGSTALAEAVDAFLVSPTNPDLAFANSGANGYVVVEAGARELAATYVMLDEAEARVDYTGRVPELLGRLSRVELRTAAGGSELFRRASGVWKKWDPSARAWV
jgi:alkaline phosphatase D